MKSLYYKTSHNNRITVFGYPSTLRYIMLSHFRRLTREKKKLYICIGLNTYYALYFLLTHSFKYLIYNTNNIKHQNYFYVYLFYRLINYFVEQCISVRRVLVNNIVIVNKQVLIFIS